MILTPGRSALCLLEFTAVHSSSVGEWLSLVEHLVRDQGVGGSNPLSPTILSNKLHRVHRLQNPVLCRCLCRNWLSCFLEVNPRGETDLNDTRAIWVMLPSRG